MDASIDYLQVQFPASASRHSSIPAAARIAFWLFCCLLCAVAIHATWSLHQLT